MGFHQWQAPFFTLLTLCWKGSENPRGEITAKRIEKIAGDQSLPGGSDGKASTCNVRDLSSIPGWGRSSGEGNGNPFQHSCLENPMDRGPGRLQSMGSQSDMTVRFHFQNHFSFLSEELFYLEEPKDFGIPRGAMGLEGSRRFITDDKMVTKCTFPAIKTQ